MGKLTNLTPALPTLPPRVKMPPKIADSLYTSPEWRRLVADIKRERGRFCERCGGTHRVLGDHIVEVKDGGAQFDRSNIELLCQACHNRKTAQQRARRARFVNPSDLVCLPRPMGHQRFDQECQHLTHCNYLADYTAVGSSLVRCRLKGSGI